MTGSRFSLLASCLVLSLAGSAAAAAPAEIRAGYSLSLLGLPIARAELTLLTEAGGYRAKVVWRTVGPVGLVAPARGEVSAEGRLADPRLDPRRYRMTGGTGRRPTDVTLGFASGDIVTASVAPPPKAAADLVPLTDRHRFGVLDPLTAALLPGAAPACARTLSVFDGWTRWDLRLTKGGDGVPAPAGIAGPVETCAARWVPIAGHRATQPNVRRMAATDDIEVTLGRPGGSALRIPVHAAASTPFGRAVLSLDELSSDRTPATGRPMRRSIGPEPGRGG
jgi:hypothetical protein